jgi:hypothetical protein
MRRSKLLVSIVVFGRPQDFPQVVDGHTMLCHVVFNYFADQIREKR